MSVKGIAGCCCEDGSIVIKTCSPCNLPETTLTLKTFYANACNGTSATSSNTVLTSLVWRPGTFKSSPGATGITGYWYTGIFPLPGYCYGSEPDPCPPTPTSYWEMSLVLYCTTLGTKFYGPLSEDLAPCLTDNGSDLTMDTTASGCSQPDPPGGEYTFTAFRCTPTVILLGNYTIGGPRSGCNAMTHEVDYP